MIEFNTVFGLDLKDDFEELGRGERNFNLDSLIEGNLSRAFAFGYYHLDWVKEGMWFPTSIRKELRHLNDNLERYNSQLNWINSKYSSSESMVNIQDYANYVLDNLFCDNHDELVRLAILLGMKIRTINEKHRNMD